MFFSGFIKVISVKIHRFLKSGLKVARGMIQKVLQLYFRIGLKTHLKDFSILLLKKK